MPYFLPGLTIINTRIRHGSMSVPRLMCLMRHQDELQTLYTGGTVFHGFLGERVDDWRMVARLVRKVMEQFEMPYFNLTPTFTICPVHGYMPGEHFECPHSHGEEESVAA